MHQSTLTLRLLALVLLTLCLGTLTGRGEAVTNPAAVTALIDRIGGEGAAGRFVTLVDPALASGGKDVFVIASQDGKPLIKGSSTLAVTTGLNWYLNHTAHINLAWNNLTTDLTTAALPAPAGEERRTCEADYRYYLNYCTFSYSMATWTWARWQQEIDWMALHGINMPLQIVGLDVVWHKLLTQDLGYSETEAGKFIAGPAFQAWWGMNNLEGWGGPNPAWWYKRQETLAKKILARQRELGMQPVLPGYAGMVPSDIGSKGYKANNQGAWCYFVRPYILDPNSQAFTDIAAKYYKRLEEVMGTSTYYSMDPFHEGANTQGIDVPAAYSRIAQAMTAANKDSKWVIQFWQWSGDQYNVLSKVSKGRLIVLDLFSDAHTHFGEYQGHDAVYCILPNFGGRTGLFGRLTKVMTDYYAQRAAHSNVKGVGATPEAIEQAPVLYDALFELPWRPSAPDAKTWLADYTLARYGKDNAQAREAWELLRRSALNCETALQGPQEAVLCARPALQVGSVSSWGGTDIFYRPQDVATAAAKLLAASADLSGANYSYDLTDVTRQALTDYGYYLLKGIYAARTAGDQAAYARRRDAFLQLTLDLDELLSTNKNFLLGRWTQMARAIADEESGTTEADRQWLELNNARTLITTWGDRDQSEYGGLRDYSYREWAGMLKDFYYPRWKTFFDNLDKGQSQPDWFSSDWAWAHDASLSYADQPKGSTVDVARRLMSAYLIDFTLADGTTYPVYRRLETDARQEVSATALRGKTFTAPLAALPEGVTATLGIDFDNDGRITADETTTGLTATIPATAVAGKVTARLTLSDGTIFTFRLTLKDEITAPRTVSVATADAAQGSVSIEGSNDLSVTGTDEVTIKATPVSGYDFTGWTDAQGRTVSTDNPYTYYGAQAATFTAHFITNKWGAVSEDRSELSTLVDYGQYLNNITASLNGAEAATIFETADAPEQLNQTTQAVKAPQGAQLTLHWTDKGGMGYCRLSAYADLNCDGDFTDAGELLAVVGDKGTSGNTQLSDYTLKVLLPYDVPLGVTHIRLRFDSSWMTDGLDATTDAMPAAQPTKRMVYDIPVDITDRAATACTVTVQSADKAQGTVDANGQTDTYTYGVGEEVVLRCYPAAGYKLTKWTDAYGRTVPESWRDGNFLRFHAPESGTYTAHFGRSIGQVLTLGDWTFSYTQDADGAITLTKVLTGEGALTIPATYEGYAIKALAPGTLRGQAKLTSLSLPASVGSLGSNIIYEGSLKGSGVQNATFSPASPLPGQGDWQLHLDVSSDGSSFNQWGSALLATGTEALADSYPGGFQLYLKADGGIVVKTAADEVKTFTLTQGQQAFAIDVTRTATGKLTITATAGGQSDSYEATDLALSDITTFSTALPAGVDLTTITLTDPAIDAAPLRGCTALSTLTVATGNKAYKAVDNALYTADGSRLIAVPEGLRSRTLTLPATVTEIGAAAVTAAPNLRCIATTATVPPTAAAGAFEARPLYAVVPAAAAAAYRTAWGLPLCFRVAPGETLDAATAAAVQPTDLIELLATDDACGTAPGLAADIPVALTRTLTAGRYYPLTLPATPTETAVEGLDATDLTAGGLTLYAWQEGKFVTASGPAAGSYLVAVPAAWSGHALTLTFPRQGTAPTTWTGLTGNTTADELTPAVPVNVYTYDSAANQFTYMPSTADVLPSLRPFGAALVYEAGMPETLSGPGLQTGLHGVTTDDATPRAFTPDGRRATRSTRGVVIRTDGRKVIR